MNRTIPTRERLRIAALNLFVQKGVAETTTRELAALAGVAEGTIYRHYISKEDLVRELFEEHYFRFGGELDRIRAETAGGCDAKLGAMTSFMASLYEFPIRRSIVFCCWRSTPLSRTSQRHCRRALPRFSAGWLPMRSPPARSRRRTRRFRRRC